MNITITADGIVPHYWHAGLGMHLAVKLVTREVDGGAAIILRRDKPLPQRLSDGRLIYALPGGGDFCEVDHHA